jgi:1,4-dihydroxy-2-naphthoate octaprenyltransferase
MPAMIRLSIDFFVHFRLKFQLLVAPAAFLLGVLLGGHPHSWIYVLLHFLNVHIILFGTATAFNSYYDKDEIALEGLEYPPHMSLWMLPAALVLQGIGLTIALASGIKIASVYSLGMIVSFLYSHPSIRLKGSPLWGMISLGLFGGIVPFFIGLLAAGMPKDNLSFIISGVLGICLLVIATFPLAQAHQIDEDRRKGDNTFSAVYGIKGVKMIFATAEPLGVILLGYSLSSFSFLCAVIGTALGLLGGGFLWVSHVRNMKGGVDEYRKTMRLKTYSGLGLNLFLLASILLKIIYSD